MKTKTSRKFLSKNNRGFTLIELLAIIAIIGLLIGAILVSLQGIRERSERKSLMRTMGTVVRAAGVCETSGGIDYSVPLPPTNGTTPICNNPVGSVNYVKLDEKLENKGYGYQWQTQDVLEGIKTDGGIPDVIIECSVDSGSCEQL